jgi:hypothetical protein
MSRLSLTCCALAWQLFCLAGTEPARASAGIATSLNTESPPTDAESHERSRQFFERGIHLFQHGNVVGALAEFEAGYQIHPNSAALQNIALCQKALFRYREAKATLEMLLARHEHEMTSTDTKTIRSVSDELTALIGVVKIAVRPHAAKVSIDDTVIATSDLERPVELDVGEHRLRVEADGYEPAQRLLTIAGGTGNLPVSVTLNPTHGFLTVLTPNEHTAIAVDGRAVAFESYRGIVLPGRHVIQIYRSGFEPYEAVVELEAGQSVTVRGKVGDPTDDDDEPTSVPDRHPSSTPRQLRGWYGLLDVSLLNWTGAPEFTDPKGHRHLGYGYGLHAGYRLYTPIGIEAVIGATHHEVTGTCEKNAPASYCFGMATENYELDTRRAGGALRIMSGGEKIRFTSSVGIGAVSHDLRIFSMQPKGFDAYFALEAGAQVNIDHFLIEMVGFGWFESAGSIKARNTAGQEYAPYQNGNGIQMFGISLRAGWSEWTPRDAR